jgi:uncharacterized membrane protein HdeD (DUF308 family)
VGSSESSSKTKIVSEVAFGVAVIRGIAALAVGLLLIFYPEKSGKILANMMGIFWLVSGIALLRRSKDDALVQMIGTRTARIIAVVGLLTGLLVVTRSFSRQILPEGALIVLLGMVIMLTGVLHAAANIRFSTKVRSQHHLLNIILGVFEIVFGLTLVLSPLDRSPASYWFATIWALVFGVLVIGDAIKTRSSVHKAQKVEEYAKTVKDDNGAVQSISCENDQVDSVAVS